MSADRQTVTAEGHTLMEAVRAAATMLGVDPAQVDHKFDAEHFRNRFGAATGQDTVKIHAWKRDEQEYVGGEAARAWLAELLKQMGLEGTVRMRVRGDQHADLLIDSESARFLVGKQGKTLKSIRHLLAESVGREHSTWTYHLEVTGGEERRERRDDRDDRREGGRDDRGERRGRDRDDRGRGRDRDDRGRGRRDDRGRDDRGHDDDRRPRSEAELDGLRRLARKVAEHVLETGEPEVIRKRLNSYERRVVHMTISEIEGVASESIKQEGEKRIQVFPAGMEPSSGEE